VPSSESGPNAANVGGSICSNTSQDNTDPPTYLLHEGLTRRFGVDPVQRRAVSVVRGFEAHDTGRRQARNRFAHRRVEEKPRFDRGCIAQRTSDVGTYPATRASTEVRDGTLVLGSRNGGRGSSNQGSRPCDAHVALQKLAVPVRSLLAKRECGSAKAIVANRDQTHSQYKCSGIVKHALKAV
jgi:hypothetical protein